MSETVETKKSRKRRNTALIILLLLIIIGLLSSFKDSLLGPNGIFYFSAKNSLSLSNADSLRIADSLALIALENSSNDISTLTAMQLQHFLDSLASLEYGTDSLSQARKRRDLEMAEALRNALQSLRNAESARIDSLKRISDSIAEYNKKNPHSKFNNDSLAKIAIELSRLDSLRRVKLALEKSQRETIYSDSLEREKQRLDSLKRVSEKRDTIAPWLYPDPSGGLHYAPVKIGFTISEPCSVFWRFSGETQFTVWNKKPIALAVNEELFFYAVDTAGNRSEIKSKKYVFEKDPSAGTCPDGMTLVYSAGNGYCIDKYEWPNKKGAKPTSNVSFSEATDSCFSRGKRLCTSSEWESACTGKYGWNYPYGSTYEQHGCVTQESGRKKSGEFGECRGWYAVHDMVGNLAEWTSTRAGKDKRSYIVKGGFWESGKGADCRVERYSYYPQNRHNPVGFRCCSDAANK